MSVRLSFIIISVVLLAIFISVAQPPAQAQSECVAVIEPAFTELAQSCSDVAGNQVCYGSAAAVSPVADSAAVEFASAGDTVDLSQVQSVSTQAMAVENGEWGLALMNVHADVPRTISEQGVTFVLLGDVELENAVAPETAFTPAEPITVTALVGANIRSSPSTEAQVVNSASAGTELVADGLSADQSWLRIITDNGVAWISRQVVGVTEGDLETLPVITSSTRSAMQSFFLRANTDDPVCSDAPPSMLLIQSPEGTDVSLTVNGIDIEISSTIVLRLLPGNVLQLITLDGGATSGGIPVPAGFTMTIQLSDDLRSADGFWTGLRAINEEERAFLLTLENLSGDVMHYVVHIPTQQEITQLLTQMNRAGTGQAVSGPAASRVDCSGFRPTSPLDGLAFGSTNFYWDAAPGATQYRLNVFDSGGALVRSVEMQAQNTTLSVDTGPGGIGGGSSFAWNVDALVDGQLACSTAQVTVLREAGTQPVGGGDGNGGPPPTPTACPWTSC